MGHWIENDPFVWGGKINTVTGPGFGPKQEVVKEVSEYRDVTVTPAGLTNLLKDLLTLQPQERRVRQGRDEFGDWKYVNEPVPVEEIFTSLNIRNGEKGNFVVKVSRSNLDFFNVVASQDAKVKEYESVK